MKTLKIIIILLAFVVLITMHAAATTRTWNGSVNGNWSQAANWSPPGSPQAGDGVLIPAGASHLSTTNDLSNLELATITFAVAASVSGNSLTVTKSISGQQTGATALIRCRLTLGDNLTISTAEGFLEFTGAINLNEFDLSCRVDHVNSVILIRGNISGAGGITKRGPGTLSMMGANSYSGVTTLQEGGLHVGSPTALGSSVQGTVLNGGVLGLGLVTVANETLTNNSSTSKLTAGPFASASDSGWSGNIVLNADLEVLVPSPGVDDGNGGLNLSGIISGAGALTKTGGGRLVFSGSAGNTFSGDTWVREGTLELNKADARSVPGNLVIGSSLSFAPIAVARHFRNFNVTRSVTVNRTGLYDLNDWEENFASPPSDGSPILRLNGGGDVRMGAGALILPSNSTVLVDPGTSTGSSVISGRLRLEVGDHTFLVNTSVSPLGGAALDLTASLEALSSGVHVTKTGPGEMRLAGHNNYTGNLVVDGGRVTLASSTALGASSGTAVVNSNAVLAVDGSFTFVEPLTLNSTAAPSLTILSGACLWTGDIVLNRNSTIHVDGSATLNLSGSINGRGAMAKIGEGRLTMGGLTTGNTYDNTTTVVEGSLVLGKRVPNSSIVGPLVIGDGIGGADADVLRLARLHQIANLVPVVINASGLLDLNDNDESFGSLAGSGNVALGAAANLEVGSDDDSTTFSGVISGGGNFWKHGLGTMTLNGNNTYTGMTVVYSDPTVGGGTLRVNGSQPQSSVVVSNGCTLGGSGRVGGIAVAPGGSVSPGDSTGILTCGNVTFGPGSMFVVELNGASVGAVDDQLDVRGTVTLSGAALIIISAPTFSSAETYTIIHNDGGDPVVGIFAGLPQNATVVVGRTKFSLSYTGGTGNDVVLTRFPTLTINLTVSNIVHRFTPPVTAPHPDLGVVIDELVYDKAGLTNVNLADYSAFELRLFAPNGQRIIVNSPTNYSSALNIYYTAGPDSSLQSQPATLSFENFFGAMPSRTYSFFGIFDGGNNLDFQAQESYTGPIEFSAMKYEFTRIRNPANTPKTFISRSNSEFPVCFHYRTSQTTDPGPFVTMIAMAQPRIEIVYGTGGVTASWMSRSKERYQPQWTTDLMGINGWSNLGPEISGTGSTASRSLIQS